MVDLRTLKNGNVKLIKEVRVRICTYGWTVVVPVGFESDGASVPRIMWPIIGPPMRGRYLTAAIVHDYLCNKSKAANCYTLRAIADVTFLYLLKQSGVGFVKRSAMYLAVRWWGRFTYRIWE